MNLSKREVLAKFSTPARNSKILCLQERGTAKMSLDNIGGDGWLPREGTSNDPNGTDDITSIVGAASENGYPQSTTDVLRRLGHSTGKPSELSTIFCRKLRLIPRERLLRQHKGSAANANETRTTTRLART